MTTLQPDQSELIDSPTLVDIIDFVNDPDDERLQDAAERARLAAASARASRSSSSSSSDSPSTKTVTTSISPTVTSTPTATPTSTTSTAPPPENTTPSSDSGLTKAQIGGAAAGAIIALIFLGIGLFFIIKRCRKPKKKLKDLETKYSTLEDALRAEKEEKNEYAKMGVPVEIDGNVVRGGVGRVGVDDRGGGEGLKGAGEKVVVEAPGAVEVSELDGEGIGEKVWRGLKAVASDD